MKIRVEHDALADTVAWVARNLSNRPMAPILAGLLMNTSGDEVTLSSFDPTTSAQVTMSAEVTGEGMVLVSGRLLNETAYSLSNKPVEMVSDHIQVELICGSARSSLRTFPVEEYPTLPEMPTQTGLVDASALEKFVSQIVITAGRDEPLNIFTDVRVEINGDRLSLLATDRYRMALKEPTWRPFSPDIEDAVLVPGRVLADTAKSLTSGEIATVSLSTIESEGKGLAGFTGEGAKSRRDTIIRLLNQAFLKVRRLMDVIGTVTVRIPTVDLLAAAKRVSPVAEHNTLLRMFIEDDHISLEATTGDQAHVSEATETQVDVVGEEKSTETAGFNPHYLLDALGALDAPYAYFSFVAPDKSCLIMGLVTIDGDQLFDYHHVIMLMCLPSWTASSGR